MADLGRATTSYVSAHDRTRVHASRLFPNERRSLIANFNGAIPEALSIVSVVWRMDPVYAVAMADAEVTARTSQVTITACWPGRAGIRCEVTLDNGEVYNQLFAVDVQCGPWFADTPLSAGPASLSASV